ncbi:MAG: hypothetical protein P0S96_02290 [Simkaniaceae bacterium]|nr:hypothetical protein [Candidatus Sacchlamyda saccharinae]
MSEFFRFYQKRKNRLAAAGLACFAVTFLGLLAFSKPYFLAESSFRQVQSHMGDSSSVQSMLKSIWNDREDAPAVSVMQSKALLGMVVEDLGLQIEPCQSPLFALLKREKVPFLFSDVSYEGDRAQNFFLRPLSESTFEVLDPKKKLLAMGSLNEPVSLPDVSWTLQQMPQKQGVFRLIPKRDAVAKLKKGLKIKPSRLDANLLVLKAKAAHRQAAMGILNGIMSKYQRYLQAEHEELSLAQIQYLEARRDQLGQDFEKTLNEHATYLKDTLGVEGFLGLTQEVEMLSAPKEKYSAQKHAIDFEIKNWTHPWKEGREKHAELDWEETQITASEMETDELAEMDLETAKKLRSQYSEEGDRLRLQLAQLKDAHFSQVLKDPTSQDIIQKEMEISLQLADHENRTEKDLQRLKASLSTQQKFLAEHIEKKRDAINKELLQLEKKLMGLRQRALELLKKEKESVEQKLAELSEKMGDLPEKWRLESLLKLKKELSLQILEGLTQLSESKLINSHLFHIESKPLDMADAPLDIQPPHLFLFSLLGAILGAFLYGVGALGVSLAHGFPLSPEYLRDRNFQLAVSEREILERINLEMDKGAKLALIGPHWTTQLKKLAEEKGIALYECPKPASSPEALHALSVCDQFLLKIQDEKAEDLVPFEGKKGLCVLTK